MICFASRYIPVYTDVREAKQWEKNPWSSSLIPEGSYIANRVVISFETVCYTSFWKRKKTKIIKFSLFLSLTRSRLCIVIIKQRDSKQIPYCDFQLDLCFPLILPVFSYARRTVIQQNGFSTFFFIIIMTITYSYRSNHHLHLRKLSKRELWSIRIGADRQKSCW